MMKNRLAILLLLFTFASLSFHHCKKKETKLSISGTVFDPNLNQAVSDATVDVYVQKVTSGSYQGNYSFVKTLSTDANGKFTYEQDYELVVNYRIDIRREGYFTKSYIVPGEKTEVNEPYSEVFDLLPEGWLKLHVKTYNANSIKLRRYYEEHPECSACCNSDYQVFTGNNLNLTTVCRTYGAIEVKVKGDYNTGNEIIPFSITKTVQPFDTTTIEVSY